MQDANHFGRRSVLTSIRPDTIEEALTNSPVAAQPRGTTLTTQVARPGIDRIEDPQGFGAAPKSVRPRGFNS